MRRGIAMEGLQAVVPRSDREILRGPEIRISLSSDHIEASIGYLTAQNRTAVVI